MKTKQKRKIRKIRGIGREITWEGKGSGYNALDIGDK